MFNFHKLLTSNFWFYVDPVILHRTDTIIFGAGIVLVIMGIVFRLTAAFAPNQLGGRVWQRLSVLTLTIGILEMVWYVLRYQHVPVLASHFAAALILLIGIFWFYPIFKYRMKQYSKDMEHYSKEQLKQKYLQM